MAGTYPQRAFVSDIIGRPHRTPGAEQIKERLAFELATHGPARRIDDDDFGVELGLPPAAGSEKPLKLLENLV
jgi:hypothetical protein